MYQILSERRRRRKGDSRLAALRQQFAGPRREVLGRRRWSRRRVEVDRRRAAPRPTTGRRPRRLEDQVPVHLIQRHGRVARRLRRRRRVGPRAHLLQSRRDARLGGRTDSCYRSLINGRADERAAPVVDGRREFQTGRRRRHRRRRRRQGRPSSLGKKVLLLEVLCCGAPGAACSVGRGAAAFCSYTRCDVRGPAALGLGSGPGEAGGQFWAASGTGVLDWSCMIGEWSGRMREGSSRGVLLASVLQAAS